WTRLCHPQNPACLITLHALLSPARRTGMLDGATVTDSGLGYIDEVVGDGPSPRMDQDVTVHYTGSLASNGVKFDSSVDRGVPATFPMRGVIRGFSEGLSTMRVGGKRKIYIPSDLGYGPGGAGPIPPNADLIFDLELIAIH